MKKLLTVIVLLAGAVGAYAQGTIWFTDYVEYAPGGITPFAISVYSPQVATPSVEVIGNGPDDSFPAGTFTGYTGTLIGGYATDTGPYQYANGDAYTMQLFAAPGSGIAASSLLPVTQYQSLFYDFGGSATQPTLETGNSGQFVGASPSPDSGIPGTGTTSGPGATVQLRAWFSDGGLYPTYASALAASVPAGADNRIYIPLLGGYSDPIAPTTAPDLSGLESFSLVLEIPEPSSIALGVMGASAFLLRRRKSAHSITRSAE